MPSSSSSISSTDIARGDIVNATSTLMWRTRCRFKIQGRGHLQRSPEHCRYCGEGNCGKKAKQTEHDIYVKAIIGAAVGKNAANRSNSDRKDDGSNNSGNNVVKTPKVLRGKTGNLTKSTSSSNNSSRSSRSNVELDNVLGTCASVKLLLQLKVKHQEDKEKRKMELHEKRKKWKLRTNGCDSRRKPKFQRRRLRWCLLLLHNLTNRKTARSRNYKFLSIRDSKN